MKPQPSSFAGIIPELVRLNPLVGLADSGTDKTNGVLKGPAELGVLGGSAHALVNVQQRFIGLFPSPAPIIPMDSGSIEKLAGGVHHYLVPAARAATPQASDSRPDQAANRQDGITSDVKRGFILGGFCIAGIRVMAKLPKLLPYASRTFVGYEDIHQSPPSNPWRAFVSIQ